MKDTSMGETEEARRWRREYNEEWKRRDTAEKYEGALWEAARIGDVSQINALFTELEALGDKDRKLITGIIEKTFIEENMARVLGVKEALRYVPAGYSFPADTASANAVRGIFQVFTRIAQIMGDAARPYTKACAQEIKKLSDDERKSLDALLRAEVRAYDAADAILRKPKRSVSKGPGE